MVLSAIWKQYARVSIKITRVQSAELSHRLRHVFMTFVLKKECQIRQDNPGLLMLSQDLGNSIWIL